jgi:hypothetical protein
VGVSHDRQPQAVLDSSVQHHPKAFGGPQSERSRRASVQQLDGELFSNGDRLTAEHHQFIVICVLNDDVLQHTQHAVSRGMHGKSNVAPAT